MNRILLCMIFMLLASLCGPSARADYTITKYTPSATLIAPTDGSTYTAYSPNTTVRVPASITNQWVDVSGAAPPSTVVFGYSMADYAAKFMNGGNSNPIYVANDSSNGTVPVLMDKDGHWRRYLNGGSTGSLSTSFSATPGSYSFTSGSILKDSLNNDYGSGQTVQFSVDQAV